MANHTEAIQSTDLGNVSTYQVTILQSMLIG